MIQITHHSMSEHFACHSAGQMPEVAGSNVLNVKPVTQVANDGLDQLPVAGDGPVPLRVIGMGDKLVSEARSQAVPGSVLK